MKISDTIPFLEHSSPHLPILQTLPFYEENMTPFSFAKA